MLPKCLYYIRVRKLELLLIISLSNSNKDRFLKLIPNEVIVLWTLCPQKFSCPLSETSVILGYIRFSNASSESYWLFVQWLKWKTYVRVFMGFRISSVFLRTGTIVLFLFFQEVSNDLIIVQWYLRYFGLYQFLQTSPLTVKVNTSFYKSYIH